MAVIGDDEVSRSSPRDRPSGRWRIASASWSGSWEAKILKQALEKSRANKPTLLDQSPLKEITTSRSRTGAKPFTDGVISTKFLPFS